MMRQAFFSAKITAIILGILAGETVSFASGTSEVLRGSDAHDVVHEAPWRQGDMDKVLAEAEREHQPILVYWGAVWCPPCNELKAEVFSHPKFNDLIKPLIAVYLDGDQSNAQTWGETLKISGYPTVLLLGPKGEEWMRLTASTDFQEFQASLSTAIAAAGPATEALAHVESGNATENDWKLLAHNQWSAASALKMTPEVALKKHAALIKGIPSKLKVEQALLAAAALSAVTSAIQALEAVPVAGQAAVAAVPIKTKSEGLEDEKLRAALEAVRADVPRWLTIILADQESVRSASNFIIWEGADLVSWLEPVNNNSRQTLESRILSSMSDFSKDKTTSTLNRLLSINPKIKFAVSKMTPDSKPSSLPAVLIKEVRGAVALADHDANSRYDRHAVVSEAADFLIQVGDFAGARSLLVRELKKTNTPWYYQGSLANLEQNAGRISEALKWSSAARVSAKGRATRIQWIVSDLSMMSELTKPADKKNVGQLAKVVAEYYDTAFTEIDGFAGRNKVRASRVVKSLRPWVDKPLVNAQILAQILAAGKRCATLTEGKKACEEHFTALR